MIDSSGECHFRRLEWIIRGKVNGEEKDSALVGTLWGTHDGGLPVKQVVANWACAALGGWISAKILEFFVDSFECHFFLWLFCCVCV